MAFSASASADRLFAEPFFLPRSQC